MQLLLLCRCGCIRVFLDESGLLRDHVRDATNDRIGDAKLVVDQLIGVSLIPGERREQRHFCTMKILFG